MRYFKRKWNEARGDQYDSWGTSTFFFETDDSGFPSRQIEKYYNGIVLKYDNIKTEDKYGMLGDQQLDFEEFNEFEILKADFENEWESNARKFVTSEIIGTLFQNDQFDDWWESEPIEIPFFEKKKLKITFMDFVPESDLSFIREADQALTNFLRLTSADRTSISELAYKNCMDFLEAVEFDEAGDPLTQIKDRNEIWNFIQPTEIYATRRPYQEQDTYIQIACECDWEQEHRIQLVFRQGKQLTRISDQDGHLTEAGAFDKPDKDDELLSQFDTIEKRQLPTIKLQ